MIEGFLHGGSGGSRGMFQVLAPEVSFYFFCQFVRERLKYPP